MKYRVHCSVKANRLTKKAQQREQTNVNFSEVLSDLEIIEIVETEWRVKIGFLVSENITRGQSNLTKSASRGAHSPVMGHPRGSKFVPLNSWGRGSY